MQSFRYRTYGLQVESEIECQSLLPGFGDPDVRIRYGGVPAGLESPNIDCGVFQSTPTEFLLNFESLARIFVRDGSEISVEPHPGADQDQVRAYVFGSLFGVLLHQRHILPLHGSAIRTPRGAVLFLGPSGRGKSTLAAEFGRRGYPILSDDICAITAEGEPPCVQPGRATLLLLPDALAELGLTGSGLTAAPHNPEKRMVPMNRESEASPVPVIAAYTLEPTDSTEIAMSRLKGFDKVSALAENVYRVYMLSGSDALALYFDRLTSLAQNAQISAITRPSQAFRLKELADKIELDLTSA